MRSPLKEKEVLFLGRIGGREAYYEFGSERFVVFLPTYWTGKNENILSVFEILRVPLVLCLSFFIYFLLRNLSIPVVVDNSSVYPLLLLSCASGLVSSYLLAASRRKIGRERFRQGKPVTTDELSEIYSEVRKNTRTVLIFLPILVAFLIVMPVLLPKIGTILVFLSYMIGWFVFGLTVFSFHPLKRLAVLRKIECKGKAT